MLEPRRDAVCQPLGLRKNVRDGPARELGEARRAHHRTSTMFSFPLLTNAEILLCLNELELGVTEAELLNPDRHRDKIRAVLEQLAEMCSGVTREDLCSAARASSQSINYPELHEDSVIELALFRAVADVLRRPLVGFLETPDGLVEGGRRRGGVDRRGLRADARRGVVDGAGRTRPGNRPRVLRGEVELR